MSKRAGVVSAETKERLIKAAKSEFTKEGFTKSSLRSICREAGVTTGALYFFFDSKDDLFESIISEVTKPFTQYMQAHYRLEHDSPNKKTEISKEADFEISKLLIDLYFKNQEVWDILRNNLSHPFCARFLNDFTEYSTDHYMFLLEEAVKASSKKIKIDRFAIHQFVHMQTDTMLTLISQDFDKEEMIAHSKTVTKMLRAAFNSLLEE